MKAVADGGAESPHWKAALQADIDAHFAAAHARVEALYQREFRALGAVARRHWRCRSDIPADLAALPRSAWRLLKKLAGAGRGERRPLTAKEQQVSLLLAQEVLRLDTLQALLLAHLQQHPAYSDGDVAALRAELAPLGPEQAAARLHEAVARWGLSHDSGRDLLFFLGLGVLGRGLSDKIAFGSASLIGMSLASSLYLGQQGWFAGLWARWLGVPAWVTGGGVLLGFSAVWLLTPLLAPLVECGFNRLWSRRRFHSMVDEVHRELSPTLQERFWAYGSYLQFIPDALILLRQMR